MPGKSEDHVAQLQEQISVLRAQLAALEAQRAEHERAEAALSQSEQRLKDILDNTTAVIYVKDTNGHYLHINRRYEALFHVTREQVVGQTDHDLFPKEQADTYRSNDQRVLGADAPIEFEEVVSVDDGLHTYISVKFPLRDAAGKPYAVCGISTDITERKRADEHVRKAERHLRMVLDHVGPHIMVGLMTPDGIIVEANQPGLGIAGLEPHEVLGKPCEETYWFSYSDSVKQRLREAIRRAANGETIRYDMDLRVGENRFISIDFSLHPLMDEGGRITHLVPSATDVTERKRAMEELRESELRYRTLVETMPHGIREITRSGIITFSNTTSDTMLEYEPGELIGKAVWDLLADDDAKKELKAYFAQLVRDQPPPCPYFAQYLTKHGRRIDVRVDWDYERDEHGEVTGFVSIVSDITEHKRAMEELRESELRFRRLVETTPHGIREISRSGIITFSNPASDTMLEYEPGELIGKAVWNLLADDDAKKELKAYFSRLVRDQPPPCPYFAQYLTKRGRRLDVRVDWDYERDDHGELTGFVSIVSDITEHRQAEVALRESEGRLRQLTENIREVFWLHDCQPEKIVYVSPAYEKIWGRATHDLYENPADWSDAIVPEDRKRVASSFE
ncbi:MAG: PAS domain S-box protein, partial [Acidimicrobiia bacterium]